MTPVLSAIVFSRCGNDAQKTMGITPASSSPRQLPTSACVLVVIVSHAAIALGTLFGGWRIVKTLGTPGSRTSEPARRLLAETAGALTLFGRRSRAYSHLVLRLVLSGRPALALRGRPL